MSSSEDLRLVPLKLPTVLDKQPVPPVSGVPILSPAKIISLYDDQEWEEFVLEWATSLEYESVMRNGGANDHGVDIAAFLSEEGFDGEWDCYQCKHYGQPLKPGDALPEILKIVQGTLAKHYTWPRKYRFAAPRGYGTLLSNALRSPSRLKSELIKALENEKHVLAKKVGDTKKDVLNFLDTADFSVFGSVELHELVEQHSRTRWHSARFSVPLQRPSARVPADSLEVHEQDYIQKLLAAYRERHPDTDITPHTVSTLNDVKDHYSGQRRAFYSAESLRVFARDSVPDGTFDALQEEIVDGTSATYYRQYADGWARLDAVTDKASSLALTANHLVPVLWIKDRIGICHQLANDGRMIWCRATSQ